jgi:AcrR family transcriptional regulator
MTDAKKHILTAALRLATAKGYLRITRDEIATTAACATGLVSYHFGTMTCLRRDVMRAAVRERNLPVLAQGLVAGDPHARRAPDEMKCAALAAVATA